MPRPALTCPHCGKRQSGKQGLEAHIKAMHPAQAMAEHEPTTLTDAKLGTTDPTVGNT